MRKSTLPVAAAMVAAFSVPAYAGKYSCNFLNGTSVVKQCDIESGASNYYCQYSHSNTLEGLCYVQKGSAIDRIQCQYGNPQTNIAALPRDVQTSDAKIASEQPGFVAGGVTLGDPTKLLLTVGYRENTTAPLFQVQCVHKP